MKVQIKRNTNSAFGYLQVGDELDVDSQVAKRWENHNIAVVVEAELKSEPKAPIEYESMGIKELRAIAKKRQIDKYYKLSKDNLILALEGVKHEQN